MKQQVKVPTARQLPSGKWFVQLRIKGQSISITRDSKKQAVAEALAIKMDIIKSRSTPRNSMTLHDAMDDYIRQRENVLSPSTIAGYRVIQRNRFKQLQKVKISDITSTMWQRAVNDEARTIISPASDDEPERLLSPKTLKNSSMFVQTVVAEYGGEKLSARLPQVVPNDLAWLTPEQIPVFLGAIKGNKYEIPSLLALSSLRQSEIVALQWRDIDLDAGTISVHGSAVLDDSGKLVQKNTNKNLASRRTVPFLIPQLREAVMDHAHCPDEYVYPHYSNVLRLNINKICNNAGLPAVGVHGPRRSFASLCYHLGISEAVTMISGGWSDFRTMRKIYTKISENDIRAQAVKFTKFFENANISANEE